MIKIILELEVDEKGIKLKSSGKPNKKFNNYENELTIGLMKVLKAFLTQASDEFNKANQAAKATEEILKNGTPEATSGQPDSGASTTTSPKDNLIQLPHRGITLPPSGNILKSGS